MDLFLHVGMFPAETNKRIRLSSRRRMMELYLQFGHGMMQHCRHLIELWGGGTAVLSPRDLTGDQLQRLSGDITGLEGGRVLLDPQFYLPHADHHRLCAHDFWPDSYNTGAFFQGQQLRTLLVQLRELNTTLGSYAIILPGLLASQINDDWIEVQRAVAEDSRLVFSDRPVFSTIALSAEATADQDQIAHLLETAPSWETDGFYLVCEHPRGDYLVDDPNWLANVLDLAAGLRLRGSRVILGYCNHQMLVATTAKVDAICSGTWMNVRSFPPDKFRQVYDDEIRRRAVWYYCPQALSEYKIPFLDIASRQQLLQSMIPPPELDGGYSSQLFGGAQPTAVGLPEQLAFRHYLHSLRGQALAAGKASYDETIQSQEAMLNDAEDLLANLSRAGVRGQGRDFADHIDVNRAALSLLDSLRGAMLRRRWSQIS